MGTSSASTTTAPSPSLPRPERARGRVYVLSEYGGLGLRVAGHRWKESRGSSYRLANDREDLERQFCELVSGSVAGLVEDGLSAVVYTQLVDVEIELNGLATYDRRVVKIDHDAATAANQALIELGSPESSNTP